MVKLRTGTVMTLVVWSVVMLMTSWAIANEDDDSWETPGLPNSDFVFDNALVQGYIDNNDISSLNDYYFGDRPVGGSNMNIQSASSKSRDHYTICKDCKPIMINRAIDLSPKNFSMAHPTCIKVMTCSGCCAGENEDCSPIEQNPIPKTEVITVVHGRGRSKRNLRYVQVYEHVKCGCKCMITQADCKVNQIFRKKDCSCECKYKPTNCSRGKSWNRKSCMCVCRAKPNSCKSTKNREMTFNATTCRCTRSKTEFNNKNRAASYFRKGSRSVIMNNLQYDDIIQTAKKTASLYKIKYPKFHLDFIDSIQIERKSICKPKLVDVPLPIEKYDYAHYFPDVVEINQCSGSCIGHFSKCKPTITKEIQLTVLRMDYRNNAINTVTFNFTQHLECGCQCDLTKENCNPLFGHMEHHNCECLCRKTGTDPMDAKCVERDGKEYKPPSAYEMVYTTFRNISGKRFYRNHYEHSDIASVEECGLLCRGKSLSECRAYEYHSNNNCMLFKDNELRVDKLYRNKNDRKLYIRRDVKCLKGHLPQTYAYFGMMARGGHEKTDVTNVNDCRNACIDDYLCLGVNFIRASRKCYLNYQSQELVLNSEIDHYKIIDRCVIP